MVISRVRPEKRFERMFCTDRDRARPTTLTRATRELVLMPRALATMMAAMTQSTALMAEVTKPCRVASSFLDLFRALLATPVTILMTMKQMTRVRIAERRLETEMSPILNWLMVSKKELLAPSAAAAAVEATSPEK